MLLCSTELLCCPAEILDFHEDCSCCLLPCGVEPWAGADTWFGRCDKIMLKLNIKMTLTFKQVHCTLQYLKKLLPKMIIYFQVTLFIFSVFKLKSLLEKV